MAAALSRALKLPGKKGPDLGEYDPLTQADSEDESEDDDLVLNYPRNGHGRDSFLGTGSSKQGGSRSGRLVGVKDEAHEDEEEEEEEDEWRERLPNKPRQDRDDMKAMQYWGHRDSGRDRTGEERAAPGSHGGARLGVHSMDAEEKRMKNVIRSAFFLVPLVCITLLVLLCAFLIPCLKGELEKRRQWEMALGDAGGVVPPALALWDVDGDSVEDVILGVTERSNDTHHTQGNKIYRAVALSAVSGQVLWRKDMEESLMYIQCGLQLSTQPSAAVVLLITKSMVSAVNGTTGKIKWEIQLKDIVYQAVLLPDLQGDSVPDLLIATLPADQKVDLCLTLISGLTGVRLGPPVPFNLTGQGKLIGPLLHQTQHGAYYILFGLGNVEAISLRDIYFQATGKMPMSQALRRKDAGWERLKESNSSSFIHIYRGSENVDFLLPLVAGFGNDHNRLDSVSNSNSTKSDWLLVYGSSKVSLLRQKDVRKEWTFTAGPINSEPAPGHFNDDGILDVFIQHSANGIMQCQVVDGAKGRLLWMTEFVCPHLVLGTSVISTSTGQSVFLFWASEPIKAQKNFTRTTVSPGVAAAGPLIRKLFLLHPAYPTILLELSSITDTAVTSTGSYDERQKDATYITVSSRPTPESEPGARIVKSMSLRAAIAKGQIIRLGESINNPREAVKPGTFEVNTFFRRLSFKRQ